MTDLETMARNIAAIRGQQDFFDDPRHPQGTCPDCDLAREQFRAVARAGLATIRDPSPAVVEAMVEADVRCSPLRTTTEERVMRIWCAGIDAMMKEDDLK